MAWWIGILEYRRRAGIIAGVALVHFAGLAAILSHVFSPTTSPESTYLEIELAEITPPPSVPDTPPEPPAEAPEPAQSESVETIPPPPTNQPPTASPSAPEPSAPATDSQTVLTQLDQSDASPLTSEASGRASEAPAGEVVTAAQIATVLQQADCLKLKRHEEGACPEPDPFAVAIASAKRAIPPERLFADPRYVGKTVSDKVFEAEAANRFHWPDDDLFNDTMSPGAYNARRIRNGQDPLWSKDMRDGFKKSD